MKYNPTQVAIMRKRLAQQEALRLAANFKGLLAVCLEGYEGMNDLPKENIVKLWEKKYGQFDG